MIWDQLAHRVSKEPLYPSLVPVIICDSTDHGSLILIQVIHVPKEHTLNF